MKSGVVREQWGRVEVVENRYVDLAGATAVGIDYECGGGAFLDRAQGSATHVSSSIRVRRALCAWRLALGER